MRKGDDTNNHLETLQEADEEEDRSFAQERQPSDGLMQSLFDAGTRTDLKMPPEALEATGRKRVSFSVLTSSLNPPREKLSRDSDNAAPNVHANARQRSGLFSGFSFRSSGNTLDDNILRQSALRRTTGRANASANLGGGKQTISTAIQFGRRSAAVKASGTAANAAANAPIMQDQDKARATYRRYRVGDSVLVCNTQSRWANLVNRYGYPAGGGVTPEEQRGPYIYVLATVKKVHFEEDAEYYTVTRADTGADQRADAGEFLVLYPDVDQVRIKTSITGIQNGWNLFELHEEKLQLCEQQRRAKLPIRTLEILRASSVVPQQQHRTPQISAWKSLRTDFAL